MPAGRVRTRLRLLRLVPFSLALGAGGCGMFDRRADAPTQQETTLGPARAAMPLGGTPVTVARPNGHTTRVGPYAFHTDQPIDSGESLYRELEDLPEQIERELQLPVGNGLIHVYLFEDEERYHAFLKAKDPKLPLRSAYFFAEPARGYAAVAELQVYTWFSPRLKTDLRHELTHALLHGVLKAVPIWLDEGLAGFFEQPAANDGVNVMHLDALRHGEALHGTAFRPDLARLEKLKEVGQMGRAEYQESWAWVHCLLRGEAGGRKVLLDHLKLMRTHANVGSLSTKLESEIGDPNVALVKYLAKLDGPKRRR